MPDLWTPEQQKTLQPSPLMERLEALERRVREIEQTMSMPEQRMPPEERWRDVTGECKVYEYPVESVTRGEKMLGIVHAGKNVLAKRHTSYRLRKVTLRTDEIGYKQRLVEAFIVERREP